MQLLTRRHLVVHTSLRETTPDRVLEDPVQDLAGALRISSAHALLEGRAAAHDALRRRGVKALDVTPSELPGALVDRDLAIKRAGRLRSWQGTGCRRKAPAPGHGAPSGLR